MSELFRPAAVESVAASHIYRDALRIMRPRMWGAGLFIVALMLAALVWSIIFHVPVAVVGKGILLAPGGVIDVMADAGGQVLTLEIRSGDEVGPGMVVARIAQPDLELKLRVARGEYEDALKFRDDLAQFQERDSKTLGVMRAARSKSLARRIAALQERRAALLDQRADLQSLVKSGTVIRDRLMALDYDILAINSQIADAEDEHTLMTSEAAIKETQERRDILEAERRVTEAQRQLRAIEQELQRLGAVRSPFAGRVVEVKANLGQLVQPGTAILTLERRVAEAVATLPVVVAYVTAADGKKIRVGMQAEVSPANTQREEHGFLRGQVVRVSEVPASSAGMMRTLQNDRLVQSFQQQLGTPFEVTIALVPDPGRPGQPDWSSRRAASPKIDSGTLAEVRLTVRSMALLALAIPAIQFLEPGEPDRNGG